MHSIAFFFVLLVSHFHWSAPQGTNPFTVTQLLWQSLLWCFSVNVTNGISSYLGTEKLHFVTWFYFSNKAGIQLTGTQAKMFQPLLSKWHALPGNTALDFVLLLSQLLQLQYSFGLNLKEGFVGWQSHVVHAFRIRDPQSGSLAPSQQQDCHFTLRNAVQT